MYWNHRIVRKKDGDETILMFAEVYYQNGKTKPYAYSDPFMFGDSVEDMVALAKHLLAAAMKPVLEHNEFDWEAYDTDLPQE